MQRFYIYPVQGMALFSLPTRCPSVPYSKIMIWIRDDFLRSPNSTSSHGTVHTEHKLSSFSGCSIASVLAAGLLTIFVDSFFVKEYNLVGFPVWWFGFVLRSMLAKTRIRWYTRIIHSPDQKHAIRNAPTLLAASLVAVKRITKKWPMRFPGLRSITWAVAYRTDISLTKG